MRTFLLVLAVLANAPALAHADSSPARFEEWSEAVPLPSASTSQDAPAPQQPDPEEPAFTIGLNSPLGWLMQSFGGSLSVGLGGHGALRATFTRNQAEPIPLLLVTGGESAPVFGRIIDAGLGWVWYPRQLWDGFTIEAGALLRNRRDSAHHEDVSIVKTHSMTYAARAMIGWTSACSGPNRSSPSCPPGEATRPCGPKSCASSWTPTSRLGRHGTTTRRSSPTRPGRVSCASMTAP